MTETRRRSIALTCSLLLHALIAGFLIWLVRMQEAPSSAAIDSAVTDDGPMALYMGSIRPTSPRKPEDDIPSEEQMQRVRVELPAVAPSSSGGFAPQVEPSRPGGSGDSNTGQGGSGGGTFFGSPVQARSVVYLIDRSLSMGVSGALASARSELLGSLRQLPPGTRFQVLFYNRSALPLAIQGKFDLQPTTREVIDDVERQVQTIRGEGGTDHVQALRRGLAIQTDVLYLVSDADDLSAKDVQALTELNAGRTAISCVDLGTGRGAASSLQQLASANRGVYIRGRGKK